MGSAEARGPLGQARVAGRWGVSSSRDLSLIPLSVWQVAMGWPLIVIRCISGAAVGAIPGILIGHFGNPKVGVSVSVLGGFVGVLLSLPGVSLDRTLRLLLATLVTYNVKGADGMYEWVDRDQPVNDQPNVMADTFNRWVMGADVAHRRQWLVVTGFVVGLIAGGLLAVRECALVNAQQQGIFLPLQGSKDPLITQAILLILACGIWSAALIAVLAAPAFGRPVQLGVMLGGAFAYMIGYANDNGQGANPLSMATFFATGAAAAAMLFAACVEIKDLESSDSETPEG